MPGSSPVTLQDVADRAGVSRATASLGLRGKGRMSDETRARIQRAAAELDYVVNVVARNLRMARSGAIGLHVPDISQNFRYYLDVAFGAVERAQESDVLVTLVPTPRDFGSALLVQLDGFILIDADDDDPVVARILSGRQPVVCGEDPPASLPAPWAVAYGDHARGMRMLLDHVLARGARHPACILPVGSLAWSREMARTYEAWCAEHDLPSRLVLNRFDDTPNELRARTRTLLEAEDAPDAVVTAPEGMATIVLEVARELGREIGRELLLASYVDNDVMRLSTPPITALDLSPRDMGRATAELLIGALEGAVMQGTRREVPIVLRERASTLGR